MPLVSVIIPSYKRSNTIAATLQSVLAQTLQDFEIFVVDDGSKDNTKKILTTLAQEDSRIHYLCHETNRGAQAARNTGARSAKGTWFVFLDSDDLLTPDSLAVRISTAQNQGVKVVHSECEVIHKDESKAVYGITPISGDIFRDLLISPGPLFSGLLIAKEALEAINYLDEQIISYQDWDTVIRLAKLYSFGFVEEPTFIYDCRGDDNISKNMLREAEGYKQVFNKHFLDNFKHGGPRIIAQHYQSIANRYQLAGHLHTAKRYQILSFIWWPFRLKDLYRKITQIV
jgi:glycosyltransferase involved in cell wall biosynthesis